MTRFLFSFLCLFLLVSPVSAHGAENAVPRKLVGLYDGRYEMNLRYAGLHRLLEMPANRLGYDVQYFDVREPLPELGDDVHGILVWFTYGKVPDVETYIKWLDENTAKGKKLVIVQDAGIGEYDMLSAASRDRIRAIEDRIGMLTINEWHNLTYNAKITERDSNMVDFERKISAPFPAFVETRAVGKGKSHLRIEAGTEGGGFADLIITGPGGGYVAPEYLYHVQELRDRDVSQWYVNPFRFLEASLQPPLYPVPDVTTMFGRRLFYAHIDGDGWNNLTQIASYREKIASSADVIEQEILRGYPDFPFGVGIVVGDVAENCFGSEKARKTARSTLALPNVEATSHTYTHPLYWQYFEDYSVEDEKQFSAKYPKRAGVMAQNFGALLGGNKKGDNHVHEHKSEEKELPRAGSQPVPVTEEMARKEMLELYDTPRSYDCVPFDEHNEIVTAKEIIESLAPEGKTVKLIQWSGNTSPYERFLKKSREAGLYNLNGGESRFDGEYPSYSTLYPIGVRIGDERQVYSTASNENTYTNLWSERFFGYRYLVDTLRHTESPIRVTPFNVYFHSYSGERQASLEALKVILNAARKEKLLPIMSSEYAAIANGFYSAQVEILGNEHWRINNRGALQTLRIDRAGGKIVDMGASTGVLGQSHFQENLYIFLNPSVDNPEIKLIQRKHPTTTAALTLLESRWNILSAKPDSKGGMTLELQGYGKGEMTWAVPTGAGNPVTYRMITKNKEGGTTSTDVKTENGIISLDFGETTAISPLEVSLQPLE